jgi:hypothetical protein
MAEPGGSASVSREPAGDGAALDAPDRAPAELELARHRHHGRLLQPVDRQPLEQQRELRPGRRPRHGALPIWALPWEARSASAARSSYPTTSRTGSVSASETRSLLSVSREVIDRIRGGTAVFVYYPDGH